MSQGVEGHGWLAASCKVTQLVSLRDSVDQPEATTLGLSPRASRP